MHRRAFCRRVAVGSVATSLGVTSAVADDGSAFVGTVSTRGHFEIGAKWWDVDEGFQDEKLVGCHSEYDYSVESIPGVSVATDPECGAPTMTAAGDEPEELVVMCHGFGNPPPYAREVFGELAASLSKNGYDSPVVGFTWDADLGEDLSWWDTEDIADRNGKKLAAFVADYLDATSSTSIRLVGHSLGSRVVLSTLEQLRSAGLTSRIPSATVLGAAVPATIVGDDERYARAVAAVPDQFTSYYKEDDETLNIRYKIAEVLDWQTPFALGRHGVMGTPPANFAEVNVTDDVSSHSTYYRPGGCVDDVVKNW